MGRCIGRYLLTVNPSMHTVKGKIRMYHPAQNPATGKATNIKIKNQTRLHIALPLPPPAAIFVYECSNMIVWYNNHKKSKAFLSNIRQDRNGVVKMISARYRECWRYSPDAENNSTYSLRSLYASFLGPSPVLHEEEHVLGVFTQ